MYDHLEVFEKFLGFYEIPNISSSTIVSVLKDILTRYNLTLDLCRGQCYDGVKNMLGKKSGVAVQIKNLQPLANYTHCHTHSLSLSVKDVTKPVKIFRDAMGVSEEIIVLIKYSPKRENLLGQLKDLIECDNEEVIKVNSLVKLSQMRCTIRAECFKRILDNYDILMSVWDHFLRNENLQTDLKSRIIGVKTQMESFDFFLGLTLGHRLYAHIDNLSRTLETQKMSACNSQRNVELTISVLEKMRYDCSSNQFYDATQMKAKSHHFVKDPIVPRKRKAPNYSILLFIDDYSSETPAYNPDTCRDRYRAIYYKAIDSMVGSIKDRFMHSSFEVFEYLESLL